MNLTPRELALIIQALESDTIGTWGDERSQEIDRLINKIKREKASV